VLKKSLGFFLFSKWLSEVLVVVFAGLGSGRPWPGKCRSGIGSQSQQQHLPLSQTVVGFWLGQALQRWLKERRMTRSFTSATRYLTDSTAFHTSGPHAVNLSLLS